MFMSIILLFMADVIAIWEISNISHMAITSAINNMCQYYGITSSINNNIIDINIF